MSKLIGFQTQPHIRKYEFLPWILAIVVFFVLPEYLSLGCLLYTSPSPRD